MPDDVEVTDVKIPSTRTMSDHILFQIDVVNSRKRQSFSKWTVLKRFGQFYEMDQLVRSQLMQEHPEAVERMPFAPNRKSKLLSDHLDPAFVEQRRVLLESYLKKMLTILPVVRNEAFLAFLGVEA